MQQVEKHQLELATALENEKREREHRERLEEELASQLLKIEELERVEERRSLTSQIPRDSEVYSMSL